MIEPHSAHDGESAETEKATLVVPPKVSGIELLPPFPFAFPLPLACPFLLSTTGSPAEAVGTSPSASPSGAEEAVGSGAVSVWAAAGASDWRSEWVAPEEIPSEA